MSGSEARSGIGWRSACWFLDIERFSLSLWRIGTPHATLSGSSASEPLMASFPLGDLKTRCRRPELMDQPDLEYAAHAHALRGLGRINRLSCSGAILWPPIAQLAREREPGREPAPAPVRVLDLASGGGDVPIGLERRAARAKLDVQIEGCDISAQAVEIARQQAAARGVAVRFFRLDALNDPLPAD